MCCVFFFQAEDGIRDLVRSRGLGDVYKRQAPVRPGTHHRLQPGATPSWEELCFIDGTLGDPAQGRGVFVLLVVHADEPLRCGAKDYRLSLIHI